MNDHLVRSVTLASVFAFAITAGAAAPARVQTSFGTLEGEHIGKVFAFKGIPYAKPPVGDLRWRPPEQVSGWPGVLKATQFGARCMQGAIFPDMKFRDKGPSEDCLYLNVWTPNISTAAHLPVLVWIYGGGFQAGATSEPRQDGAKLTAKGVVVVSMNYRLGVFGFFSHPDLTAESAHHASGNYGLLDQAAALAWVQKNIAAFGGDPAKVTIFGESAGSISVSAQMASPRSEGLFQKAIGESGSVFMLGNNRIQPLRQTEKMGAQFATKLGVATLAALRAIPADRLLSAALTNKGERFWPNIDGWFIPDAPSAIYAAGKQAHVPLLAGWNADEQGYQGLLAHEAPTPEKYQAKVRAAYGANAAEILKQFPGDTDDQVRHSARDLASDRFIAFSTWRWLELQLKTGNAAVYRYHFEQAPPQPSGQPSHGAYHSADIEYVFETLDSKDLPWTPADRKLSDIISSYWTNFAKTGDPNGAGLPNWPGYTSATGYPLMHLIESSNQTPHAAPDTLRPRYELLDSIEENTRP